MFGGYLSTDSLWPAGLSAGCASLTGRYPSLPSNSGSSDRPGLQSGKDSDALAALAGLFTWCFRGNLRAHSDYQFINATAPGNHYSRNAKSALNLALNHLQQWLVNSPQYWLATKTFHWPRSLDGTSGTS